MDHAILTELAAGAALEDLDPVERTELDDHLATCPRCQALVIDLEEVLADLALVAPELRPPARLRDEVLERLRAPEPDVPAVVTPAAVTPLDPGASRGGHRLALWSSLALAAVLGVVAIGSLTRAVQLDRELAATAASLAAAESALAVATDRTTEEVAAMTLIADPAHVTVGLHPEAIAPETSAVVLYRPGSTQAFLMATDLPPTPAGSVYQLWVADDAGVHPLGTFVYDGSGVFVAPFGVDLGTSTAAMVTLEPEGGAVGDPGPEVVFGEL
jgi:hypothetical protein